MKAPIEGSNDDDHVAQALTPKDVMLIANAWADDRSLIGLRNHALINLTFATGARISEIAKAEWSHLNLVSGTLLIPRGKGRTATVIDDLPINDSMRDWRFVIPRERRFLFPRVYKGGNLGPDKPMSRQAIDKIVHDTADLCGVAFHHHQARLTLGTELLQNGGENIIRDVMDQFGHNDARTLLKHYVAPNRAALRKQRFNTRWQHISSAQLDAAIRNIINYYDRFDLPNFWGSGKTAAADGTVFNTYLNNLMTERHIRYGEYGGIAYHHVSDKYVALFSHFISVGVWEAVYIIDGLIENTSDIQPDTLHADTQGQSLTVFGISHLLGINLMPRIRNWKDLIMYRPDKDTQYENIDTLFTDTIDWELIRIYWQEMMRVILSIRQGHLMPSTILRKLGNYSRQNSLYKAFRELGRVIRTMFLLKFTSDETLRRKITATTNKVESYNRFIEWIFFGDQGVITTNNPVEMEKRVKYNDLIASAIILLNVIDMTRVLEQMDPNEYIITPDTLATLSPYMTKHLQRFGDFLIDMETLPALPPLKPISLSALN